MGLHVIQQSHRYGFYKVNTSISSSMVTAQVDPIIFLDWANEMKVSKWAIVLRNGIGSIEKFFL